MKRYKLSESQSSIPAVGLGTWQITDREVLRQIIEEALEAGYSLFDTASAYGNEMALGKAFQMLDIPREQCIIQDKVWNSNRGYEEVQQACRKSLKKLKLSYLDVYLVHWPASPKLYENWREINADTWRGMEQLKKEGLVRDIGVCNFKQQHLEELEKTAVIKPQVNQIELHPGLPQAELTEYCQKKGILIEASSPLGNGQILQNQELQSIARQKEKTVAQLCLRWAVQKEAVVLPRTKNNARLSENLDIFTFELSEEEMDKINRIPYCGGIGLDADEVTEFG